MKTHTHPEAFTVRPDIVKHGQLNTWVSRVTYFDGLKCGFLCINLFSHRWNQWYTSQPKQAHISYLGQHWNSDSFLNLPKLAWPLWLTVIIWSLGTTDLLLITWSVSQKPASYWLNTPDPGKRIAGKQAAGQWPSRTKMSHHCYEKGQFSQNMIYKILKFLFTSCGKFSDM